MTPESDPWAVVGILFLIALGIAFCVVVIIAFVVFVRWIFRIEEITEYLRRVANKLDPPPPLKREPPPYEPPKAKCDCCHRKVPADMLETIEIGKIVCPDCKKFIQSK
jgi:hypothetical protein